VITFYLKVELSNFLEIDDFFLKHSLPLFLKKVYVTTVNQQCAYASTSMNWKNGMRFDPFLVEESLYRFKTYENVGAA
jgi:hypothetical protein